MKTPVMDDAEESSILHAECFNSLMAYTHSMNISELLHGVERQAKINARFGGDPNLEATVRQLASDVGKDATQNIIKFAECTCKHQNE